jgi:hypothetical protein
LPQELSRCRKCEVDGVLAMQVRLIWKRGSRDRQTTEMVDVLLAVIESSPRLIPTTDGPAPEVSRGWRFLVLSFTPTISAENFQRSRAMMALTNFGPLPPQPRVHGFYHG